jgi:hypothetical protein
MPVTTIQCEGWFVAIDREPTVPLWIIEELVTEMPGQKRPPVEEPQAA